MHKLLPSLAILFALGACSGAHLTDTRQLTDAERARSVRILPGSVTMRLGVTAQLVASVKDEGGVALASLQVTWNSRDASVASVDPTGLVAPHRAGATIAVASFGGLADTVAVTVTDTSTVPVPVPVPGPASPSFYAWPDTNVLFTGMTRPLRARVLKGGLTGYVDTLARSWTTSDPAVVTVGSDGVVTAVGAGHATVAATFGDTSSSVHVFVSPAPATPLRFSMVRESCALNTDSQLYCWGAPVFGMTGPFDRCESYFKGRPLDRGRCGEIPRLVSSDVRFTTFTGSNRGGCGVTASGAMYCWGPNDKGQMGLGFTDAARELTRVPVDDRFDEVAYFGFGTVCGRRVDGAVLCWGDNWRGNSGTGAMSPTIVTRPTPINVDVRFKTLSPGGNCALTADSTAYCWGSFIGAYAYDGCNTTCSPTPLQIKTENLAQIGTSNAYCGITAASRTLCWGYHGFNPYSYAEPVEVPGNPGIVRLEPGLFGLTASGEVYKLDDYGALWRFNRQDTGALRFRSFSGTCGVTFDDKLYCGGKLVPGQ